jgi:peptide/nickel transport system permease protein
MKAVRVTGQVVIAVLALLAALGPELMPVDPLRQDLLATLAGPGAGWVLGSDHLGRSELARLVHGARLSLALAAGGVFLSVAIGAALGLVAAWRGGWTEGAIMRLAELTLAFPTILLVLLLTAFLGGGAVGAVVALAAGQWCEACRVVHAASRAVLSQPFVEATRLLGRGSAFVLWRTVVPALRPQLAVLVGLGFATAILYISALGFLGIGIFPPTPEWGAMIAEGLPYIAEAPHLLLAPGAAIFLTVFSFQVAFAADEG